MRPCLNSGPVNYRLSQREIGKTFKDRNPYRGAPMLGYRPAGGGPIGQTMGSFLASGESMMPPTDSFSGGKDRKSE